jgi:hypothetical protein
MFEVRKKFGPQQSQNLKSQKSVRKSQIRQLLHLRKVANPTNFATPHICDFG